MVAYVHLQSIECHETTSGWGDDDVAIYFQGEALFYKPMGEGSSESIDMLRTFGPAPEKVWVKEVDAGSDEIIGTFFVKREQMGAGWLVKLKGDGSHYVVHFAVGGS